VENREGNEAPPARERVVGSGQTDSWPGSRRGRERHLQNTGRQEVRRAIRGGVGGLLGPTARAGNECTVLRTIISCVFLALCMGFVAAHASERQRRGPAEREEPHEHQRGDARKSPGELREIQHAERTACRSRTRCMARATRRKTGPVSRKTAGNREVFPRTPPEIQQPRLPWPPLFYPVLTPPRVSDRFDVEPCPAGASRQVLTNSGRSATPAANPPTCAHQAMPPICSGPRSAAVPLRS